MGVKVRRWSVDAQRSLIIEWMVIDLNEAQIRTLEQVRAVLDGTRALQFTAAAPSPTQRTADASDPSTTGFFAGGGGGAP
jgi:hypothetical protein